MTIKKESLNEIKNSLNKIGYDNNKISDNYPIITDNKVIYFDFVAFGHDKIQDTSTSCILVKYCNNETEENEIVKESVYGAAPILIVPKEKKVNIWKLSVEKKSEKIWELQYDEVGEHFAVNRVKLDYNRIVSSKGDGDQLTFFSANSLFKFATKINCELLGKEFKKAINNAKICIDINDEYQVKDLTSITMHIIAAKILNDKLLLRRRDKEIHAVIDSLSKYFSDYFNKKYLYKYGKEMVDLIYGSFRNDLSYRSIDNKILGNFYENTLFDTDDSENKKLKQELGIYYTPHYIVNNMLEVMPIELLDFRERYVLDGSCGSGSLLIGAYKKLKSLLPIKLNDEIKHKYLIDRIVGIDIDKFACEVARLELLLTSIPFGNGWKIYNEDFQVINNMNYTPSIIIANPPYKEKRYGEQTEKAALFLEKYIDILRDGGLLAIVLPESFLENNSGKSAREKLLTNIDIYEIWSLPKGIFDTNNCATTVIIGRKVSQENFIDTPFKVKIVNKSKKSIDNFKTMGRFDFDFVYNTQSNLLKNNKYKIIFSPMEKILKKIEDNKVLSDFINYTQGIQIPFYYNYPLVSDDYKQGYSKFFKTAKYGFEKFTIEWDKQKDTKYLKYDPENRINNKFKDKGLRLREIKRNILESNKVLLSMNSTPGTFWRTKAAIDREGIYPSHSFWCMTPKDDKTSLEIIAALLNSKIVNLYIGNKNRALNIKRDTFLNIPMPEFSQEQEEEIKRLVNKLENQEDMDRNLQRIDDIIYTSYNLSQEDIYLIEQYYIKVNNSTQEKNSNECTHIEETIELTGRTTEIDLINNFIKVQFVECEDEKYVHISSEIPGWLLSKDLSFTCMIKEKDFYEEKIYIKNVRALDYTYLNENEFDDFINNKINHFYDSDYVKASNSFIGGGLNA